MPVLCVEHRPAGPRDAVRGSLATYAARGLHGVAGFMILGVIYLVYLYQRHPERVTEVGLVHLDPLEEYPSE